MCNRLSFFLLFVCFVFQGVFVVSAMELSAGLRCSDEGSLGCSLDCLGVQEEPFYLLPRITPCDPEYQRQLLFDAVRCNDISSMQKLFATEGFYINVCDGSGGTALHLAVRLGFKKAIRWLCEHGIDVFIKNRDNQDALNLAESLCHYDALYLITWHASGAEFNLQLFKAIFESRVDLLPEKKENWDALVNLVIPWSGVTPIMLACQMGNVCMVQALVEHGARFDVMEMLRLSARFNRYSVVAFLLKYLSVVRYHPSCLSDTQTHPETPLFIALKNHSDAVAQLLYDHLKFCEVSIDAKSAACLSRSV